MIELEIARRLATSNTPQPSRLEGIELAALLGMVYPLLERGMVTGLRYRRDPRS